VNRNGSYPFLIHNFIVGGRIIKPFCHLLGRMVFITGYNKSFNDCITTDGLGFTLCPMSLGVDSNSDGGFIFLYGGKNRNSQVIISFKNGKLVAGQPELLNPYVSSLIKSSSRVLI
jgi:hypothetical protein